ncbi:MAG: hypothetical protein M3088_05570 [Actinomycetota bacterium]|nr:hypothetical protein [Actinomycetota bacterium]
MRPNASLPPKALPPGKKGRSIFVLGAIIAALLCALVAEWFAIELSFAESPALWKVPIVIFVLVGATALSAGALLYPRLKAVWPQATALVFSLLALAATLGDLVLTRSVYDPLRQAEVRKKELVDQRAQGLNEDRRRDYVEMQDLIKERASLRKRRDLTGRDRRLLNRILDQRLRGLVDDSLAERKALDRIRESPDLAPLSAP